MEENKEISLKEKIDELYKKQIEEAPIKKIKEKNFKLPWNVSMFKGKLNKPNQVIVQTIYSNGAVKFTIQKTEDETIMVGKAIKSITGENVLRYGKMPLVVVKDWDTEAGVFSPKEEIQRQLIKGL